MVDPIQDAIAELTLKLATARFASAAALGDRRAMGLAVAWANRELEGPKLEAFFTAADLGPTSIEARALKRIGAACPELMEKAHAISRYTQLIVEPSDQVSPGKSDQSPHCPGR